MKLEAVTTTAICISGAGQSGPHPCILGKRRTRQGIYYGHLLRQRVDCLLRRNERANYSAVRCGGRCRLSHDEDGLRPNVKTGEAADGVLTAHRRGHYLSRSRGPIYRPASGPKLFGPGETEWMKWRFQCPICGHVQTPADFKAIGSDGQSAYQECIGRHTKGARDFATKPGKNGQKSPCDYATYGLFRIGDTVQFDDLTLKPITVFPFARATADPQAVKAEALG